MKEACNHYSPDNPRYKDCKWTRLELFFETLYPKNLCETAGYWNQLWLRWSWRGLRKVVLSDGQLYKRLQAAAVNRWDTGNEEDVNEKNWNRFSKTLPILCMRRVSDDGHWVSAQSQWTPFASIAAIWCDF
jgi:hypothetical protein